MLNKGMFLSEAVDLNDIKPGCLNLIVAGTGSGKTHFATHELLTKVPVKTQALYLIDTKNGKNQIAYNNSSEIQEAFISELNDTKDGAPAEPAFGERFYNNSAYIMCYQKLGVYDRVRKDIIEKRKLIICDEFHNIFWQVRKDEDITEEDKKYSTRALKQIRAFIEQGALVVALTATPRQIYDHFDNVNTINLLRPVQTYEEFHRTQYRNLEFELNQLPLGTKALIYIPLIRNMIKWRAYLQNLGHRCEAVWSSSSEEYPLDDTQKAIIESIVTTSKIPDNIDILIINKSCETGINITSPVEHIFVNISNEDSIIQVRGRYRNDLQYLHTYDANAPLVVPEEFLGKPLFSEDKKRLVEAMPVKRSNGSLAGWTTVKEELQKSGYEIAEQPRRKNRRSYVITKLS